ncbi:hypothetical protein Trydic_g3911 [Trypoxylus dichotomus]
MIDQNPSKSIRDIARGFNVFEGLIRHVVYKDLRHKSNTMGSKEFALAKVLAFLLTCYMHSVLRMGLGVRFRDSAATHIVVLEAYVKLWIDSVVCSRPFVAQQH